MPEPNFDERLRAAGRELSERPLPPALRNRLHAIPVPQPRPAARMRPYHVALAASAVVTAMVLALVAGFGLRGGHRATSAWRLTTPVLVGGGGPGPLAVGRGDLWIVSHSNLNLFRVAPGGAPVLVAHPDTVLNSSALPSADTALVVVGDQVWASTATRLLRFDARTGALLGSIAVSATGPHHALVAAGGTVWAASADTGRVVGLDARSGTIVSDVTVATVAGNAEEPLSVAALGGDVFATLPVDNRVARIATASGRVTGEFDVSHVATDLVAGFGSLWVASEPDGLVQRLDPQTGAVVASIPVAQPAALAVSDDGMWIASASGKVVLVDPGTNLVTAQVATREAPAFAVAAAGHDVWIGFGPEPYVARLARP